MAMLSLWRVSLVCLATSLLTVRAVNDSGDTKVPVIGVSIEDFIDLDAPPSATAYKDGLLLTSQTGSDAKQETTVGHGDFRIGLGPVPPPLPVIKSEIIKPIVRHTLLTSDDEDVELSGDGSGSGDEPKAEKATLTSVTGARKNDNVTSSPSTATSPPPSPTSTSLPSNASDPVLPSVTVTVLTPLDLVVGEGGKTTTRDTDQGLEVTAVNLTVSDGVYTADVWPPVPVKEQTDEGKDLPRWSPWIRTNDNTEVRVRTCSGSEEVCNGTEAELRHCDPESNRCDVKNAVVISEDDVIEDRMVECGSGSGSGDGSGDDEDDGDDQVIQAVQKPRTLPPGEIDLQRTELEPCSYSLFDVKRGKYVITDWSLSQLVTQAKVKKWCSKPQEFLVFHSPYQHCTRYYKDLCHISMKCKGSGKTAPKARGDFVEGCWRPYVYGGQLPVGLSNTQTMVYLICQRYAAISAIGRWWGHKRSHFATLFDTKGRAPIVSLIKLTELGDTAWPDTPYFIEHGLVEDAEDTAWFLRKAKKGIVSLGDMNKCQDEDSCQLGAHQVLPADYSATTYRPAHLVWPELAGPDPLSRTATFTMTNTAPMHPALYPTWQKAVLAVRQFAAQQCGLPKVSPEQFVSSIHHGTKQFMHHYYYGAPKDEMTGPELYVASGVIPSKDPMETIGNDINVPFMFWTAVCCVTNNTDIASNVDNKVNNNVNDNRYFHHSNDYASLFHDDNTRKESVSASVTSSGKRHMSFAFYARNSGSGSGGQGQVVAAPVQQLELLLQDIYKVLPTDANVNLFPAYEGACSELKNDYSRSVRL